MSVHAHPPPPHYNMNNMNADSGEIGMLNGMLNGTHVSASSTTTPTPIRITRRLNVRIQGSLSDFAQVCI